MVCCTDCFSSVITRHGQRCAHLVGSISHGRSSLSSASSSPPREPAAASNPFAGGNGNAGPATAGQVGTTRLSASPPRPRPPVRPATAAPISTEVCRPVFRFESSPY
jgi:hypothetical protein